MGLDSIDFFLDTIISKEISNQEKNKKYIENLNLNKYETYDILLSYFNTLSILQKRYLIDKLIEIASKYKLHYFDNFQNFKINNTPIILIFYFLFKTYNIKDILYILNSNSGNIDILLIFIEKNIILTDFMEFEDMVKFKISIQDSNTNFFHNKDKLLEKIVDTQFETIKIIIKSNNIEINQDKKEVQKKNEELGFSKEYNDLLDNIDKYIHSSDDFDNASAISNLRSYFERKIKDTVKILEAEFGENFETYFEENYPETKDKVNIKTMRKLWFYIEKTMDISGTDKKFIDSFIDILHKEGGHSFVSEKEYFRLARNIAIEIDLLLLSKLEKALK
jgi:hypothetical protein